MYGFFKLPISDKKMAKVMYALLRTQSKLVNSYSHSIKQYDRKQSNGFLVDVVVEVDEQNIKMFEELAEIKLQTSEEFQGKLVVHELLKITDMTEVFEFLYTGCIHESAMATMSLHRTKKGAYKAMRMFLEKEYTDWYNMRILYGKDKDWVDKFGLHCAWAVRPIELKE